MTGAYGLGTTVAERKRFGAMATGNDRLRHAKHWVVHRVIWPKFLGPTLRFLWPIFFRPLLRALPRPIAARIMIRITTRVRKAQGLESPPVAENNIAAALAAIPIRRYAHRALLYALPYWKSLIASGFLLVAGSFFSLLTPWPLQFLVDNVLGHRRLPGYLSGVLSPIAHNQVALIVVAAMAGFVLTLGQHGLSVVDNYVNTKLEQHMIVDFKSDLFRQAQRLSLSYHDRRRAGDFMARINQSSTTIGFIPAVVPGLVQSLITLVGMFWIAFLLDSKLAVVSLVVVPFLYYSTRFYSRRIMPQLLQVKIMEGESNAIVHESVSMIRVMIAFVRERYEYGRFRTQAEQALDARVKVTVKQTLYSLAVNGVTAAGTGLVLGLGAYDVVQGRLSVGQMLVVLTYIQSMYGPLETLGNTANGLQETFVGMHRCFEIIDEEPEIQDSPNAVELGAVKGAVRFERVSFHYNTREETLKDISFDVAAGQITAIVGQTGAGKSTLVSLIPRFYDPSHGRVFIDGKDIREVTIQSLRQQISLVLQEPLLFSGSIAENIRYGRLDASMEEVVEAARAANADDFIRELPIGYDTMLGERGALLSGGERQRISVARAFLKDAPILILDEPTSSIDSKTEGVILDALDRLMVGRTTFIIAHRLSTIRNADKILVMSDGELVEEGTHEELLAREGVYHQLHDAQTAWVRHRAEAILSGVSLPTAEESA